MIRTVLEGYKGSGKSRSLGDAGDASQLVTHKEPKREGSNLLQRDTMKLLCIYAACDGWWYCGLNRGKRKANRDIGEEAQVTLVTNLKLAS